MVVIDKHEQDKPPSQLNVVKRGNNRAKVIATSDNVTSEAAKEDPAETMKRVQMMLYHHVCRLRKTATKVTTVIESIIEEQKQT